MESELVEETSEAAVGPRVLAFYDGSRWAVCERDNWVVAGDSTREPLLTAAVDAYDDHVDPGLWYFDAERLIPVNSQTIDREDPAPIDLTMMRCTGASYRQLDYWVRQHWLCDDRVSTGSGRPRTWNLADYVIAALCVRLSAAGVEVEKAMQAAQFAVFNATAGAHIGRGVSLTWTQAI